jgi:hypothetical protein
VIDLSVQFLRIEAPGSSPPSYTNHRMSQDLTSSHSGEAAAAKETVANGNGVVNHAFSEADEVMTMIIYYD